MTKTPVTPAIDDEAFYEVELKRVVRRGRSVLRPGADITLKGKVVKELEADIAGIRPVTA